MIRNLKILGIALGSVLVVGAVSSVASAAEFRSPSATTNLHVTQKTVNVFGSTAGEVTCEKATFTATMTSSVQSSVQTKELKFETCHIIILGSTVAATITTNGCNYRLYSNGTADIVCPINASIEVKASGCTVKVPEATGLKGVTYTNNGNHVDINANITGGILYNHTGFLCGSGGGTNGTYSGQTTVEGRNTSGTVVNLDYS